MANGDKYAELVAAARKMYQLSYAPYSKYRVGAALLGKNGKIYGGCNIEICSYEGSICAERSALTKAVSEGCREFEAVAVVAEQNADVWPCGICRQYLAEFNIDMVVVVPAADGTLRNRQIKELLPFYYPPSELLKTAGTKDK
jgi:cytidine deaminase